MSIEQLSNTEELYTSNLTKAIPLDAGNVTGWKQLAIEENGEPLVPIGIGTEFNTIYTSSVYFGERKDSPYIEDKFDGSLMTIFVREQVAQQLVKAEKTLPNGLHLVVFDAYRTLDVQASLFYRYAEALQKNNPAWNSEAIIAETQKYVSLPSRDETRPSPHNTGGSVDVAIYQLPEEIDLQVREINERLSVKTSNEARLALQAEKMNIIARHATLLDFGTPFDYGGEEAALKYYELLSQERELSTEESKALINRRLLYNILSNAGLEGYEPEWWHFNASKSQMGAMSAGLPIAEYGGVILKPEHILHERTKRKYTNRIHRIQQGFTLPEQVTGERSETFVLFERTANEIGNMRETSLQQAAVLIPPETER